MGVKLGTATLTSSLALLLTLPRVRSAGHVAKRSQRLQIRVMLLKAQSNSAQKPETRVGVTEETNVETSEAKTA